MQLSFICRVLIQSLWAWSCRAKSEPPFDEIGGLVHQFKGSSSRWGTRVEMGMGMGMETAQPSPVQSSPVVNVDDFVLGQRGTADRVQPVHPVQGELRKRRR